MSDVLKLPVRNQETQIHSKVILKGWVFSICVQQQSIQTDEIRGDGQSAVPLRQKHFDTTVGLVFFPLPVEITPLSLSPCLFPFVLEIFGHCIEVSRGYPPPAHQKGEKEAKKASAETPVKHCRLFI